VTAEFEHTIIDRQRPNRSSDRRNRVGANRKDRQMAEITAKVGSTVGLHARPAALLAEAAGEYDFEITIAGEGEPAEDALDASSVLSLMGLGAEYGHTVVLRAEGAGADEALAALKDLIETDHDAE
jgi:phosphocarrier protein HPr